MNVLRSRTVMLVMIASVFAASIAQAQETKAIEVTPYVALGSSGVSPVGAAIEFPLTSTLSAEADVGYRRGEGHIHALTMTGNLLFHLPRIGVTTPYLAAGIGLTEYGAPVVSLLGGAPIGTIPLVTVTMNAGGGLKMPVRDTWELRTDARWFKSVGRHGSEHFRVAQGISFDVKKR